MAVYHAVTIGKGVKIPTPIAIPAAAGYGWYWDGTRMASRAEYSASQVDALIAAASGAVTSVNTMTGAVVLNYSHVGAEQSGSVATHAAITSGVHGITAFGATLAGAANAAGGRSALGLGSAAVENTSAFEAAGSIATHAAITSGVHGITAFGATLAGAANAAGGRSALGLGTLATQDGTISDYLTIAAAAAGYQPLDGDLTTLAGLTGTNNIYYRSGANAWSSVTIGSGLSFSGGTLSANSVGMAIGGSITNATAGSILFVDASAQLGQNNSQFFWDISNTRLGIGTTSPSGKVQITSGGGVRNLVINSLGNESVGSVLFTGGDNAFFASEESFIICIDANNDQTTRSFRIKANSYGSTGGTELFGVYETGYVGINKTTSLSAMLDIGIAAATDIGIRIQGAASQSANYLTVLDSASAAQVEITSAGAVLVGRTGTATARIQVFGTTADESSIGQRRAIAGVSGPYQFFEKARGTLGSLTSVSSNDFLGGPAFHGYNGTSWVLMSAIQGVAESTAAGGLAFICGANINSIADADMYLNSNGYLGINRTSSFAAMLDIINKAATDVSIRIQGATSQSANMISVVSSASADLFRVLFDGSVRVGPNTSYLKHTQYEMTFYNGSWYAMQVYANAGFSDRPGFAFQTNGGAWAPNTYGTIYFDTRATSNVRILLGYGVYASVAGITDPIIQHATPISGTIEGTSGVGTNISGGPLNFRTGCGTGSGLGGQINFDISAPGASGTTTRTRTTVLSLQASSATNWLAVYADGVNLQVGTTTGTKIGTDPLQKIGLWNATPVVQSTGWGASNHTPTKTIDASTAQLVDVLNVLATLIEQLKTYGIVGA